jgi:hypothetical protein
MFVIENTQVEGTVATVKFACDLKACKGACCTMPGGRGAPLLDDEVDEIRRAFPVVKTYLSLEHLRRIERTGLVEGEPGDYTTPCIDHRACIFVTYEQGIAKCSFEKAFFDGKINWRKPLSCHLFPIRIDRKKPERMRFEFISECLPALDKGNVEGIYLSDFLKEALIRFSGESWYQEFLQACELSRSDKLITEAKATWQP